MLDFINLTDLKVDSLIRGNRIRFANDISKVICFPLYAILLALGNPIIDFFSLDVEGAELFILRTIPWSKVHIKVKRIQRSVA